MMFYIILGILFGVVSKILDENQINNLNIILSYIFSLIGIWLLIIILISLRTKNLKLSIIRNILFFVSMCLGYYIFSNLIYGFGSYKFLIFWLGIGIFIIPIIIYFLYYGFNTKNFIIKNTIFGAILSLILQEIFRLNLIENIHLNSIILIEFLIYIIGLILLSKDFKSFFWISFFSIIFGILINYLGGLGIIINFFIF